jgi:hypothetical protein
VGRRYRAARAACSALLLATAIGAAGTTGVSTALAVDPPARIAVSGHVADAHGVSLAGIELVVSEELPPDGGLAGFQATTGKDGGFSVSIEPWGTTDAPATLTIKAAPDATTTVVGDSCSQTWGVAVTDSREIALEGATEPPPTIELVASTELLGEVCGTTGTPKPPKPTPASNAGAPATPHLTLPPTDASPALGDQGEQPATALLVGFVVGLAAALLLLLPRPRTRRRR